MGIQTIVNYDNAANFSFNTSLIEIASNVARLRDLRETFADGNATFYANYNTDVNGTWGDGTLTGTASGGAATTSGKLDLTGGTIKYVDYDANLNADSQQVGCIRCLVIPNYSGAPASTEQFYVVTKAAGDSDNQLNLHHRTDGGIGLTINDFASSIIMAVNLGAWSPTSGVEYEFELNYDLTTGATRLFIDGVQFGSTQTGTGTRDATIALLRVGTDPGASVTSDFKLDDLVVFSAIQHTANYTPGASIPQTLYSTADPSIIVATGQLMDGLDALSSVLSAAGSDTVTFIMNVDSIDKYWDGAAWSTSDGSVAQSNTAAVVNTNAASLDLSSGATLKIKALLHSADGSTRPTLTSVTFTYDFFVSIPTAPNECVVYGWETDAEGAAVEDVAVSVFVTNPFFHGNRRIIGKLKSTTTNSAGYWELSIIETTTISTSVVIRFEYPDGKDGKKDSTYSVIVPNQTSKAFSELAI